MDQNEQSFLNEIRKDWKDLIKTLTNFTEKYATDLANINTKLEDFQPKPFWKTGYFWLGIIPYLIVLIFGVWAFINHECVTIDDTAYGFCETQTTKD